ncbi:hypothetical protein ACFQZQ_10300 [Lysobacter koreensis]|uniref:UrcA family protein n=1 Tax=Lysobacter koreensis TaxID=266122 RepID=A0ABW2YQ65_9GAMM
MNAKILILALAGALPLAAFATQSSAESTTILIDCANPTLPSQQQVARLTGHDNLGQVYNARSRLMVNSQRLCQRGVDEVHLVLAPAREARRTERPERRLAGR